MEPRPLITLTTDFGYRDPFVAIMKGVILNINPSVRILDISHDVAPQNIAEAAFTLDVSYAYFPHCTIHVVVIDPAVGSERRPLLVVTDHHYFIGPDNGVFSRIYNSGGSCSVYHITSEHYFLSPRSTTFHGRDVFAPAAAWFSKGIEAEKFGDPINNYVTLLSPLPKISNNNSIEGEVIHIDRFGNAVTNIDLKIIKELLLDHAAKKLKVIVKGGEASKRKYYSEAEDKDLHFLINSFGYLELFVNGGTASGNFGISPGEKVSILIA